MRKFSLLFLFSFIFSLAFCQEYIWARNVRAINSQIDLNDLTIDRFGNVYSVGWFKDSANFDPDSSNLILKCKQEGIFVVKYNPNGSVNWVKVIDNDTNNRAYAIECDGLDNILVSGVFSDTLNFNPGGGPVIQTSSSKSMFFAKYKPNGSLLWVKSIENPQPADDNIKIDQNDNILISGGFEKSVDFDPSPSGSAFLSPLLYDGFLAKYDSTGKFRWVCHLRGVNNQSLVGGKAIEIGELNSVYLSGNFKGSVDFDPSANNSVHMSNGDFDAFLAKYDSSGNYLWSISLGGGVYDEGSSIAVDKKENVYLTGYYTGIIDFDPSSSVSSLNSNQDGPIFISAYDKFGSFLWVKGYLKGSSTPRTRSIKTDLNDNIYLTGSFYGQPDFDPSSITKKLTSYGVEDMFFAKYDSVGNYIWAKNIGGSGLDRGISMKIDVNNNIYLGGWFTGWWIDFNPGLGGNYLHTGLRGGYLAKYGDCSPLLSSKTAIICKGQEYIFPDGKKSLIATIDTSVISSFKGCDSVVVTDLSVTSLNTGVNKSGSKLVADQDSAKYQWLKCDSNGYQIMSGDTLQEFSPPENGDYSLVLTFNNCVDTSDCISVTGVGIQSHNTEFNATSVYPNPFSDVINLEFNNQSPLNIRVYNLNNELIYSAENVGSDYQFELNAPSGMYLLEIIQDDFIQRVKLIKK